MNYRAYSPAARTLLVFAALTVLAPCAASAQEPGTKIPVAHQQIVSVNPLTTMFKWFNAEYERKLKPTATWGVSGAYFPIGGDADYKNANVFVRYYPQNASLTGFYLGGRGGIYRVSVDHEGSGTFYGAGLEVGYSWLLGAHRNFGVSMGFGVNRLFGGHLEGASLTIPTVRLLNIGWAF